MKQFQAPEIQDVISALYEAADVPLPSASRCLVQLSELVSGCNLNCIEQDALTTRSAINVLLQRGGLLTPPEDLTDDALAGFIYASPRFGCLFVERNDIVVRRRFSAAHELGHYLLHFRPLMTAFGNDGELFLMEAMNKNAEVTDDNDDTEDLYAISDSRIAGSAALDLASLLPTREQMEREANHFAVELLMPDAVVCELAEHYALDYGEKDLVWRMATEMLVSREAMRRRMSGLGLISTLVPLVN